MDSTAATATTTTDPMNIERHQKCEKKILCWVSAFSPSYASPIALPFLSLSLSVSPSRRQLSISWTVAQWKFYFSCCWRNRTTTENNNKIGDNKKLIYAGPVVLCASARVLHCRPSGPPAKASAESYKGKLILGTFSIFDWIELRIRSDTLTCSSAILGNLNYVTKSNCHLSY